MNATEANLEEQILELLSKHFPCPRRPEEKAKHMRALKGQAREVIREWSISRTYFDFERADRPPENDIASLSTSAGHVQNAINKLNEVGFKGGTQLKASAREFKRRWEEIPFEPVVEATKASKEIAQILGEIKRVLESAASDTASFDEDNCGERRGGAPQKLAERRVVACLAGAFSQFTGRRASRVTDQGHQSSHFVELVSEVFSILGTKASADSTVKDVLAKLKTVEKTPKGS